MLEGTARGEHGKRACKDGEAREGQTGCNTDHVLLCNAAVKETLREFCLEFSGIGGAGQIRVQHDDVIVFFTQDKKALGITHSSRFFSCHW